MSDAALTDGTSRRPRGRSRQRAMVLHLLSAGSRTQSDMVEDCGLSQPVMTRVIHGLMADGLVRSVGKAESTGGRKAVLLALEPGACAAAGVRLQRHRLDILMSDLSGDEIHRESMAWEGSRLSCDDIVALVARARATITADTPLVGVRIAVPGVVDPLDGTVSQAPDLGWDDPVPLRTALGEHLQVPVMIDNDVNVMCAGEHGAGALVGSDNGAMLYVGDGIGAAVMVDGRPQPGTWGAGAEIGLIPVGTGADAPRLEDVYALPAIAGRLGRVDGDTDVASTLFDAAADGDPDAVALAEEVVGGWAFAVSVLALVVDPDRIALAGAFCAMHEEHFDSLRARVSERIPSPVVLRRAVLGEDAVLRGAAGAALHDALDEGLWPTREPG